MIRALSSLALLTLSAPALAQGLASADRPEAMSFAVGAGLTIPSSPLSLNTGSMRFRFTDLLETEAAITVGSYKNASTVEVSNDSTTNEDSGSSLGLDALARYTLGMRGNVDLQVLGGLSYSSSKMLNDPEGKDNNTDTTSSLMGVVAGAGLESFVNEHWCISADALTTMYYSSHSLTKEQATKVDTEVQGSGWALPLDPTVRLMVHLYY